MRIVTKARLRSARIEATAVADRDGEPSQEGTKKKKKTSSNHLVPLY